MKSLSIYHDTIENGDSFQPKNFKSSRNQRSSYKTQGIESFVDEDDGFVGGVLATKSEYNDANKLNKPMDSSNYLLDLITPAKLTIGRKLLSQMGWKEGQGIGPRKKLKLTADISINTSFIPFSAIDNNNITTAPKDISEYETRPPIKTDEYGVGYTRPNDSLFGLSNAITNKRVYRMSDVLTTKNKSITITNNNTTGYLIDDEEDNIYNEEYVPESLEEIDINESNRTIISSNISSYVNRHKAILDDSIISNAVCICDNKPALPGFILQSKSLEAPLYFPPPVVPNDFIPFHKFVDDIKDKNTTDNNHNDENFKFLSDIEKNKLLNKINKIKSDSEPTNEAALTNATTNRPLLVSEKHITTTFANLSKAFQNRFVTSSNSSNNNIIDSNLPVGLSSGEQLAASLSKLDSTIENNVVVNKKKIKPVRTTTIWIPNPLLCKRFRIPVPDISKDKASNIPIESYESKIYEENIGKYMDISTNALENKQTKSVIQEIDEFATLIIKPPDSLFKSIFEDSDDDDDVDDDNKDIDNNNQNNSNNNVDTINENTVNKNDSYEEVTRTTNKIDEMDKNVSVDNKIVYRKPTVIKNNQLNDKSNIKANKKRLLSFQTDASDDDDEIIIKKSKLKKSIINNNIISYDNINSNQSITQVDSSIDNILNKSLDAFNDPVTSHYQIYDISNSKSMDKLKPLENYNNNNIDNIEIITKKIIYDNIINDPSKHLIVNAEINEKRNTIPKYTTNMNITNNKISSEKYNYNYHNDSLNNIDISNTLNKLEKSLKNKTKSKKKDKKDKKHKKKSKKNDSSGSSDDD